MIIRLSERLKTKIKAGPLAASPLDENPYADWSARSFTADRAQYILVSHTRSLYSVVMFGRGITDDNRFIQRALDNLREVMTSDGLGLIYMNFVAPASETVRFCKALDRSVTGSMNELETTAKAFLDSGERSPFDVSFRLNETLLSAIGSPKSGNYATPREAFKQLRM
jgi:hypothetical protein